MHLLTKCFKNCKKNISTPAVEISFFTIFEAYWLTFFGDTVYI